MLHTVPSGRTSGDLSGCAEQLEKSRPVNGETLRQPSTYGADEGEAVGDAVTDGVLEAVHVDECDGLDDRVAVGDTVRLDDGEFEAVDEWDTVAVSESVALRVDEGV
jgi:hypothetical protein